MHKSLSVCAATCGLTALVIGPALAQGPKVGDPPEARNMRLVGHNDLQARSAYQPVIHRQGNRYIAYVGHHGGTESVPKPVNPMTGQPEFNGTSIVDVTDPKNSKYLRHIPAQEGLGEQGGAQMVRVCDGRKLPKGDHNKVSLLGQCGGPGHERGARTAPETPPRTPGGRCALKAAHTSGRDCHPGIASPLTGVKPGRPRRMTEVFDLSDPGKPVK